MPVTITLTDEQVAVAVESAGAAQVDFVALREATHKVLRCVHEAEEGAALALVRPYASALAQVPDRDLPALLVAAAVWLGTR